LLASKHCSFEKLVFYIEICCHLLLVDFDEDQYATTLFRENSGEDKTHSLLLHPVAIGNTQ